MMRGVLIALLLLTIALGAVGCGAVAYLAPVIPPRGSVFAHYSAPLSLDFQGNPVCERAGQSSTYYFREPLITNLDFAWGDANLAEAMQMGNLQTTEYADYEFMHVLGIYAKFTVRAYGKEKP